MEKILIEIFSEIKNNISVEFLNNPCKIKQNLSNHENNKDIFINYINKNEKNFVTMLLLITKKITKFLTKSNKILFINLNNTLNKIFFFKNEDENKEEKNINLFLGENYINDKILFFNFDEINNMLKINGKNPFYYKTIRNLLQFYLINLNDSAKKIFLNNFDINKVDYKNQELIMFLFKNLSSSILSTETIFDNVLFCFENFNNLSKNDKIKALNTNIFSKILEFFNDNVSKIKSNFTNDFDIIMKMINFIEENPNITKLIIPILLSVGILMKKLHDTNINSVINQKNNYLISKTLSIIQSLCLSNNEEKIRFASLLNFENLVEFILENSKKNNLTLNFIISDSSDNNKNTFEPQTSNLFKIFMIFVHILNDEHPEIRNYGIKIFTTFNNSTNLVELNKKKLSKEDEILGIPKIQYNSEYIFRRILKFSKISSYKNDVSNNLDLTDEFIYNFKYQFFINLYRHNFYFSKSRALLNNGNKIFYFEPDNRYLDNIEIITIFLKELILLKKSDMNLYNKIKEKIRDESNKVLSDDIKIMDMLENFIFFFTDNFNQLFNDLEIEMNKENFVKRNLFQEIRKIIY